MSSSTYRLLRPNGTVQIISLAVPLVLRIRCTMDGSVRLFKILPTATMSTIYHNYGSRYGVDCHRLRLQYGTAVLKPSDSLMAAMMRTNLTDGSSLDIVYT